jgi:hypothetical protein
MLFTVIRRLEVIKQLRIKRVTMGITGKKLTYRNKDMEMLRQIMEKRIDMTKTEKLMKP